ncbi:diguanylate cyclase domain-containing protein, partial [Kineococcus sp. SYSU DK005]|uniref:diguanylate cyclase domain-containing protein n=1 Tax=Kineococcus sp. SYSU DK005 TaxID=3383126 RepID=UPI003D7E3F36
MQALARLARAATGDFAVDDMLRELCTATAEVLQVDGVGVMGILDEDGHRRRARFVHADQATLAVEQLQDALRKGPCRQAIETGEVVAIPDLREHRGRWGAFVAAALEAQLQAVLAVPLRSRGRSWGSLDLYRRTGAPWEQQSVAAARLLADVAVSYLVMAHDRDAAAAANRELEHRSLHDQLTGLPNRALLFDRIEHALGTARRRRALVALMFIDLDRFKDVNDTFGHGAGDEVLIELSARMGTTLRAGDTLARLAGDEFVLLCEDLPQDAEGLHRTLGLITSRLRAVLAKPVRVQGVDVLISASIGVAVATTTPGATTPGATTPGATTPGATTVGSTGATVLSAQGLSAETLLHEADTAMYAAKAAGRARVVTHDHA